MKTVCVCVKFVAVENVWYSSCSGCDFSVQYKDMNSAIKVARRHIMECKRPVTMHRSFQYFDATWEHWFLGCM